MSAAVVQLWSEQSSPRSHERGTGTSSREVLDGGHIILVNYYT